MVDSERLMQLKKAEHAKKMRQWEEMCPNGFVDANIKENMTGKHKPRESTQDYAGGGSSLEEIV